ncbi:MAG: hypothetical protein H6704_22580 [Myxococcales bacterium]|nr:hypothetical protein [Myxococcales bacterium]
MSTRFLGRWGLLALAGVGLIAHALVFDFVNDDAFISFRYADNLVRHGELVFNVGERVEGYTNFLWTMLMAGVMGLGLDPVPWSKWLGIAFGVATLAVVARFLARTEGEGSPWDAVAPLLLAAAPAFACWSTGGLETMQFTFVATLAWTAYLDERARAAEGTPARPWSGLWFALASMSRPEGMLLWGLTGLHRLVELLWTQRGRLKPAKQDWAWGFFFAIPFGAYYAWRWWYYGYPFPNTYYVKTGAKNFWGPGLRYLWSWLEAHPFLWAAPILGAVKRPLRGGRTLRLQTLVALFALALGLHVVRVGGDFMALHRFLVPLMPALAVVVALGLRTLLEPVVKAAPRRLALGVALFVALSAGYTAEIDRAALKVDSHGGVDSIGWLAMFAEQCTTIGQWLGDNAAPDETIAITAAGIIPYYSRLRTLDLLGLNDEWIAHNVPAHGNRPGHTKSAPHAYVAEWNPTYYIGHPDPSLQKPRGGRRPGYDFEAVQIPGLRIDPRRARRPEDLQKDAWWGYWKRTAR